MTKLKLWQNLKYEKSQFMNKKTLKWSFSRNILTPWQPMRCSLGSVLRPVVDASLRDGLINIQVSHDCYSIMTSISSYNISNLPLFDFLDAFMSYLKISPPKEVWHFKRACLGGSKVRLTFILPCKSDCHPIFGISQFVTRFTHVERLFGALSKEQKKK